MIRQLALGFLMITAVTIGSPALAGEADMQRGVRCGIDDYHVKMDRD